MRMIGQVATQPAAQTFSDFLLVQGIENQIESEKDGRWGVWVYADEELERAGQMLAGFLKNPADPQYVKPAQQARKLREKEAQAQSEFRKRFRDRAQIFPVLAGYGLCPATLLLVAVSVAVFFLQRYEPTQPLTRWFYMSEYGYAFGSHHYQLADLTEVRSGQVWRIFTPIFLHFGIWHILFNMLWLADLGSMIERRHGLLFLLAMVLALAGVSNLVQFLTNGPQFGGMSGVDYGLLGYIWIRGKCDPASGLMLHPTSVAMMIVWYFLCLAGWLPNIANGAHTGGLLMGMAWGYLASLVRR